MGERSVRFLPFSFHDIHILLESWRGETIAQLYWKKVAAAHSCPAWDDVYRIYDYSCNPG